MMKFLKRMLELPADARGATKAPAPLPTVDPDWREKLRKTDVDWSAFWFPKEK